MRFARSPETGAYRIVQEALTNTARQAGVAAVNVQVWTDAESLNLQVEDAGRGFVPDEALSAPRSSGLIGMQEWVLPPGGSIAIEPAPRTGTTVAAELPVSLASPAPEAP